MKTTLSRTLVLLALVLAIATATAHAQFNDVSSADGIRERRWSILHDHVDNPSPDPMSTHDGTRCWGRATFALAAYATNRDTALADTYLVELADEFPIPMDDSLNFPMKFPLPLVMRAYLDPTMGSRMSDDARAAAEEMMWRYLYRRSQVGEAHPYVEEKAWVIMDSENLDIMHRSTCLLAAQALKDHPDYAGDELHDGYTLTNHYTAWTANLKEMIRQRAMRGISVEVASPTYAKYTLHAFNNLADFAGSSILRSLATDFVTLYWADTAQDFVHATGIRGGAQTRAYKDKYLTRGAYDGLRNAAWMFGWHDNAPGGTHPMTVGLAASRYRMPAILRAMATTDKEPFQYTSRRYGMGSRTNTSDGYEYTMTFDAGSDANIVRDSYVTPHFVMGTMTVDASRDHTHLNGQNRFMGAMFATHLDARIAVIGRAQTNSDGSRGRTGYYETQGVLNENCMVVGREPNAQYSVGTDIYLSYAGDLFANFTTGSVEDDGWFFTRTGDTFIAIQVAGKDNRDGEFFEIVPDSYGAFLELVDKDAPVIIEIVHGPDLGTFGQDPFSAFCESVETNPLTVNDDEVRYTSERGTDFQFFVDSTATPRIDGQAKNVNPNRTYDSPYLEGHVGQDTVTVRFPGRPDLELNFSY